MTLDLIASVGGAARGFLETLEEDQRDIAQFPFDAEAERTSFFYTPTDHGGLSLVEMTPLQQQAALRLLAASVSEGAYNTAATVMGLENILAAQESFTGFSWFDAATRSRDPNRYFVALFGEPDASGQTDWGWRFGGHHVSVSVTVSDGQFRLQPSFLGANPAYSRGVGKNSYRPLAAEEDLARELLGLLSPEQRAVAVISPIAPRDLVTGNRTRVSAGQRPPGPDEIWREREPGRLAAAAGAEAAPSNPAAVYRAEADGIRASALTDLQKAALRALLRQYTLRMPDELAAHEQARLEAIAPEELGFAWAGGTDRGDKHYYRVQGPGLLVEYDNTQNDGNHIHTVWRDPDRDFGRDLLAEHYAVAHV